MDIHNCDVIKSVLQTPPSYLIDFLPNRKLENILLVYLEKPNENRIQSPTKKSFLEETQDNSTLDVTGSPLEVDLKGDVTLGIEKNEIIHHWSENENKHFPMSISRAREYLNSKTDIKNKEAVFAVCDGKNPLKMIVIGVQESTTKIFTCTINVLGILPVKHEELSFPAMERSHYLLTGVKRCNINYLISFKYLIFGTFLQNVKTNSKYSGSVCIQTNTSSKCDLSNPPNLINEMKLVLQVIAGHKDSSIYFLWEELCLLQNYINIADTMKINSNTEISNNPTSMDEIFEKLKEITTTNVVKREPKIVFDLSNIRPHNIIDKLWDILKNCHNLETLRNSFHYFFEELADSNAYNKVPIGNNSNMATIINGIIDGKLAVPTINYSQALEFLFEIGTEKLKNDYQTISSHYDVRSYNISNKWSQLQQKLQVDNSTRKTRITHCLKEEKVNIKSCKAKLNYLGKLHVACELIYLVKQKAFLPEEAFAYFNSKLFDKYVAQDSNTMDFGKLQISPLCEFDILIQMNVNALNVRGRFPDFCSVRLTSVVDYLEAETAFVLSKYSIIPPTIYDDFDISNAKEEMHYYVCKLESHNESI